MDLPSLITTLLSSGIISLAAARWLTKRLIDHRFAKDLKEYQAAIDERLLAAKATLDQRVSTGKAELEAQLRSKVEEYLGDQAAKRQYRLDAQKRLYTAIGPLRFQLSLACADLSSRVQRIGTGKQPYSISLHGYFGQSTVYRLLRIFTIAELIERQIAYSDFSVDRSTVNLLRFKRTAFRCLSSSTITLGHPKANWSKQVEHVFYDELSLLASVLVVTDSEGKVQRSMRFDEFVQFVCDGDKVESLQPIPRITEDFSITGKPIFWLRLVALGVLCNRFLVEERYELGLESENFDAAGLLQASGDEFVLENQALYFKMLQEVASSLTDADTSSGASR